MSLFLFYIVFSNDRGGTFVSRLEIRAFFRGNALVLRHPLIIELQQADPALGSGLFIQASDMAIQHRTGKGHLLRDILHTAIGNQKILQNILLSVGQ